MPSIASGSIRPPDFGPGRKRAHSKNTDVLPAAYHTHTGISFNELFQHSICIPVNDLSNEVHKFMFLLLVRHLFAHNRYYKIRDTSPTSFTRTKGMRYGRRIRTPSKAYHCYRLYFRP